MLHSSVITNPPSALLSVADFVAGIARPTHLLDRMKCTKVPLHVVVLSFSRPSCTLSTSVYSADETWPPTTIKIRVVLAHKWSVGRGLFLTCGLVVTTRLQQRLFWHVVQVRIFCGLPQSWVGTQFRRELEWWYNKG